MSLYLALFAAGILTILLPCILPLLPIVLGVSVAGRNPWRPLLTVVGMVVSFVAFSLLLHAVLFYAVALADLIRIATFYTLLLFGAGFLFHDRRLLWLAAVLGALFFLGEGWLAIIIAAVLGIAAMELGGQIAGRIQQTGANLQQSTRSNFGSESGVGALCIGLTLGLVWVPCAGPALAFAFALVREAPNAQAAAALTSYALGTALPLLIIGYGGQRAVHSVRAIAPYTGRIKQVAGALLILTAVALHLHWFERAQVWLLDHTSLGDYGTQLEEQFFGDAFDEALQQLRSDGVTSATSESPSSISASSRPVFSPPSSAMPEFSILPKLSRAPELVGLSKWFNGSPVAMADLRGKVVLVDFWTYSCINCIRTLPHIQGYWERYKDTGTFVLLGIHTPEFAFEHESENVQAAIDRHGLTYPIAQDNGFGTWSAFANRYWPAKYLIDADGYIRYTHFGEGAYDETDAAIRSLLAEIGVSADAKPISEEISGSRKPLTPETYLGERSWPALVNAQGDPTDDVITYQAPTSVPLNGYALEGAWQLADGERQVLRGNTGEIRMRFLGGEMNLVLGLEDGMKQTTATISIDGNPVRTITIDRDDLYTLFKGPYGEHELVLTIEGPGVSAYAFTFGA